MSVDVEIYISNVMKFFKNNPNELLNLIPKEKEEEFYKMIRSVATQNTTEGKDATLTQKQMIEICKDLRVPETEKVDERIFKKSPIGFICLN